MTNRLFIFSICFCLSAFTVGCSEKPSKESYKRMQIEPLSAEELADPAKLDARKNKELAAQSVDASKTKQSDYKRLDLKPLTAAEIGLARQADRDKP